MAEQKNTPQQTDTSEKRDADRYPGVGELRAEESHPRKDAQPPADAPPNDMVPKDGSEDQA